MWFFTVIIIIITASGYINGSTRPHCPPKAVCVPGRSGGPNSQISLFPGSLVSSLQMAPGSVQRFFQSCDKHTDRETDHTTTVAKGHILIAPYVERCGWIITISLAVHICSSRKTTAMVTSHFKYIRYWQENPLQQKVQNNVKNWQL